jgi:hypothetical protein
LGAEDGQSPILEIGCRLPEEFRIAEADFRQTIAGAVRRGKVESPCIFAPPWSRVPSKSMGNCSPL